MPIDNRKFKSSEELITELDETPQEVQEENLEETPDETPQEPVETPEQSEEEIVEKLAPKDEDPEETEEPAKEGPDYKEKFSESSREAMALHFKNQRLQSIIDSASGNEDVTEEELKEYAKQAGEDWDDVPELYKKIIRDNLVSKKSLESVREAGKELKVKEVWDKKVDSFVSSPETVEKYPSLTDNEDEFKKYCSKESRRGADMDDLVAAFLYMQDGVQPTKHKGSLLLRGSGTRKEEKPAGLSEEDVASVRVKDPKQYRKLIKEGKIKIDL